MRLDGRGRSVQKSGNRLFSRDREAARDIVYCATVNDVPKLRELRRRALYRQSDECFYDYNALTRAIMMVRAYTSGE